MYVGNAGADASPLTSVRPLVQFSLANISSNMIITSATLQLFVPSNAVGTNGLLSADFYRLLVPWVEGNGTYVSPGTNDGTTGATWYKRDKAGSLPNWSSPGADAPGVDRASSLSFTLAGGVAVPGGTRLSANVTTDVQAWVNGSATNFGWIGFASNPFVAADLTGYATRENNTYNGSFHPTLIISYTPIPEPTTLALIGLGALLCLRRRSV